MISFIQLIYKLFGQAGVPDLTKFDLSSPFGTFGRGAGPVRTESLARQVILAGPGGGELVSNVCMLFFLGLRANVGGLLYKFKELFD
jgi:hypothetical protein